MRRDRRYKNWRWARTTVSVAIVAACGSTVPPVGPGQATALITGEVARRFSGTASFTESRGSTTDRPAFNLSARTQLDGIERELIFEMIGTARPAEGRYRIRNATDVRREPMVFSAVYLETDSAFVGFASDSGTLTITRANATAVEGAFDLVASRYCLRHSDGTLEGSCDPLTPRSGVPVVGLSGSLSALRAVTTSAR